ncbi:HTH-type transcriptional regulator LutR [Microbacterium oxydans]|uniref:HTH-type transcriptional regulator LutR n=1 Tax=Microbacterium oxydans TaxID=82380 RepID=A0A0F0LFQ3_9MICO|nr:FCD domain-containing protein [Microbacterium oxydans]KJL32052.1 HTH-type transcriptional regulator LutR [Microbacterium oxydans]CAH0209911.1 HTH-type transcriptional regulator LutR [Microbacterium oxydans]
MDLASPALGSIRRTTAVDTVRARISLAVELGMLTPGQRLPGPEDTARAFEVSEMTVRRAYRQLSDEGVVVRRPGHAGGTFIADAPTVGTVVEIDAYRADAAHVHALIDQRATIEAGLAALVSARPDAAALARMDTLVDDMRTAADWTGFRTADAAFHAALAEASGVSGAAELHHRVSHELYAYFIPYRIDYLRDSNEEHARLVDALRANDAATASRLAFDHVAELHASMYVGLPRA